MAGIMQSSDAISGKEGSVFITIDGNVYEYAELIKISARAEYIKADVKSVNRRMKGNKVVGMEGTGSMEIHYHRPEIREMALRYMREGVSPVMEVLVKNADVQSRAGKQTVILKNLIPDDVSIAELDGDTDDVLKDEFDFTYDDFDFLDRFSVVQ